MVRFSILKNPIHTIFVDIKQRLILDPNLDQLENWVHNKKSKYMFRFSISKNPKNSIFVKIKLSLILDPLDLYVDQFENTVRFGILKNPNNSFFDEIKQSLIWDPFGP